MRHAQRQGTLSPMDCSGWRGDPRCAPDTTGKQGVPAIQMAPGAGKRLERARINAVPGPGHIRTV
jgi:hypothetical protein